MKNLKKKIHSNVVRAGRNFRYRKRHYYFWASVGSDCTCCALLVCPQANSSFAPCYQTPRLASTADTTRLNVVRRLMSSNELDVSPPAAAADDWWLQQLALHKPSAPAGYVCHQCSREGHHIQNCPQVKFILFIYLKTNSTADKTYSTLVLCSCFDGEFKTPTIT